jgi:hypothetical protein
MQCFNQIKKEVTCVGVGPPITPAILSLYNAPTDCKQFYKTCNNTFNTVQAAGSKEILSKDLNICMGNDEWKWYYLLRFQTSIDRNLRYFRYIIIHRILKTNRVLYIIKEVDQEHCSFCNTTSESLVHLFVECDYVTLAARLVSQKWLHSAEAVF